MYIVACYKSLKPRAVELSQDVIPKIVVLVPFKLDQGNP